MANANNVEIQQQLNKLLIDQKRIMRENTRSLQEQAEITQKIVESLSNVNINNDVINKSKSLEESLKVAGDHAKQFGKQSQDMASMTAGALEETDDGFQGLIGKYGVATSKASAWGAAAGGFVTGITNGFNLLKTGLSGVISLAGSAVQGMFSIGKAILAIPFKVFNAFINEANRMQGEPLLAREFEETRKAFGDFGEDLSKHVIQGYKNLRGELAETGLSTYRVLGFMHERLKFVREQFEALGSVAHVFGLEIAQQSEYFAAYQKGLGLSGDMMKSLAQLTQGTGDTFEETLRKTTNFTTSLGKQFGISQKVIGRDVGEMSKDLKTFGSVGVREMAQLSVYSRKLGADFKDLLGIVDKFDNFEDAAEGAARMAQAFGMNIDAMDMIAEQDLGKRVDMVRKSFYQAGKDITKLTRQERNYLAQTTGIADQALNSVFALDKQGIAYEDMQSAGQTAEQQQITQAEAMEKLSDSIERMIKSGSRTGGFFDRFMMGFKRGVRWSGDFRDVMIGIKKSLWAAERAGRKVGQVFVEAFPGVKQLLSGMKDLFDPKKYEKLGGKVLDAFRKFFKDLGDPQKAKNAFKNLLNSMKEAFSGMEGDQKGAIKKVIGGFKELFGAIGQIMLSAVKTAMKNITKLFEAITIFVKGDKTLFEAFSEVFGSAGEKGTNALLDILFNISKELGPVAKDLWKATKGLLLAFWNKIVDWWKKIDWEEVFEKVKPALKAALSVLFGPAVIKALAAGLGTALKSGIEMAFTQVGGFKGLFSKFGKAAGVAGGVAFAVTAAIGINQGLDKYKDSIDKKFGETERVVAAGTTGIIDALTFGLMPDWIGEEVANWIAGLSEKMFNSIEGAFGKSFADDIKNYLRTNFELWGSAGELITSFFSGDEEKIKKAASDFIGKTFNFLKELIIRNAKLPLRIGSAISAIFTKAFSIGFSLVSGVYDWLADALKDVPILGTLAKVIADAFSFASKAMKKAGQVIKSVIDGIGKAVDFVFRGIIEIIKSPIESFKKLFSKKFWVDLGNNVWEGITSAFNKIKEYVLDIAPKIAKEFSDGFDSIVNFGEDAVNKFHNFKDKITFWKDEDVSLADKYSSNLASTAINSWNKTIEKSNLENFGSRVINNLVSSDTRTRVEAAWGKFGENWKAQAEKSTEVGLETETKTETKAFTVDDIFSNFDRAAKFDPKKIKKLESKLIKSKEIILKKGGVKDQMKEISEAFSDFDSEKFTKASDAIGSMSSISDSISKISGLKINIGAIESIVESTKTGISVLEELSKTLSESESLSLSSSNSEKLATEIIKLSSAPIAVIEAGNAFTDVPDELLKLSKSKVKDLAIVKAISKLIQTSNHINSELSNLSTVNVKPKLENLGKVLGLKGSESLRIEHENFNVNINVEVKLDPSKLADAIADTKKFVTSTKTNKKL